MSYGVLALEAVSADQTAKHGVAAGRTIWPVLLSHGRGHPFESGCAHPLTCGFVPRPELSYAVRPSLGRQENKVTEVPCP